MVEILSLTLGVSFVASCDSTQGVLRAQIDLDKINEVRTKLLFCKTEEKMYMRFRFLIFGGFFTCARRICAGFAVQN